MQRWGGDDVIDDARAMTSRHDDVIHHRRTTVLEGAPFILLGINVKI